MKLKFLWLFVVAISLNSCIKESETINQNPEISEDVLIVNKWIQDNMQMYYLWEDKLPSLNYATQPDSYQYFYDLLYDEDRWSYITDDYDGLINALNGVSLSYGFSFVLAWKDKAVSDEVICIVEYVSANTPASEAGIQRGDIFYKVNGTVLTENNLNSLLASNGYNLEFYDRTEDGLQVSAKTVSMTAAVIYEDPILLTKIVEADNKKVGYMAYNGFIYSKQDSSNLVNAMKSFAYENISELVLDLRYNPGGYNVITQLLGSIVAPAAAVANEEIFFKYIRNIEFNNWIVSTYGSDSELINTRFLKNVPVNLNLSRIFIITLDGTASASELMINGLDPHMDVVQIGDTTYGKYTASIALDDYQYNPKRHNWGMLPIVAKVANKVGVSDYGDGIIPEYLAEDDYWHQLGDPNEEMLSVALGIISGQQKVTTKAVRTHSDIIKRYTNKPLQKHGIMIMDK